MPFTVESVGGRVVLLSASATLVIGFSLWFSSSGPFLGSGRRGHNTPVKTDPVDKHPPNTPKHPGHYPLFDMKAPPGSSSPTDVGTGVSYGAEPDFDPQAQQRGRPGAGRTLLDLLRLVPTGHSVLGALDLDQFRRYPWAKQILSGHRIPRLRGYLDRLGLDPAQLSRVAFGVDLEARAGSVSGEPDHRFLGRLDRPFSVVATGHIKRKALLQQYRLLGPLAAAIVMGRRIYRRTGQYALTFPVRDLVAYSYRRPMGPLLQLMLEDATRAAITPAVQALLKEGGLAPKPPFPLLALAWTPQAKRRIPWPFNRLGGKSIRGAVLYVRVVGKLLRCRLSLLLADVKTAKRIGMLLRYVRRLLVQHPRARRNPMKMIITSIPVRTQGNTLRISIDLHAWHLRALLPVLAQLLSAKKK